MQRQKKSRKGQNLDRPKEENLPDVWKSGMPSARADAEVEQ